ncbi:MAG: hypothetical protein ABIK73_08420 [candidate division WOR-3 bacterium]
MRFVVTLPSPTLEQLAEIIGLLRDIKEAYSVEVILEENVRSPEKPNDPVEEACQEPPLEF